MSSKNPEFKSPEKSQSLNDFVFRNKQKPELLKLKDSLEIALPKLSKCEMENPTSEIRKYYVKKFHRRKTPKYGSLNKGFTSQELQAFFRVIDDDKFHLIFAYQAQLGLRIGEVCRLHLSGINFQTRELILKTEKAKVVDSLIIPMPLFTETVNSIRLHESQIEQAGGYLFFKDLSSVRTERFIGPNYVRSMFRRYVIKAGLDFTYDMSDESSSDRATRSLHRLTTHSLRHYAITSFSKQTNGNVVLTSRFARHSDPGTTMTYINTNRQELYDQIDGTFSASQAIGLKARISKRRKPWDAVLK